MIWLTWRQYRSAILCAACCLVILTVALLWLGYATSHPLGGDAESLWTAARLGLLLVPLLAAIFLGAPLLAGDIERGTHRLVWTQGLTRRTWLVSKLGVVFPAILLGAALLSVMAQVAIGSQAPTRGLSGARNPWLFFDQAGLTLPAYVVFGVALGAAAGAIAGRTLLAMVATTAIYAGGRILVENVVRPRYLPPLHVQGPVSLGLHASDWITGMTGSGATADWSYQPANRFWLFQGVEAGLFAFLAVLLLVVTARFVLRRQG